MKSAYASVVPESSNPLNPAGQPSCVTTIVKLFWGSVDMKPYRQISLFILMIALSGCSRPPLSFMDDPSCDWDSITIPGPIEYDEAWAIVAEVIAKNHDIDRACKDSGLLTTPWHCLHDTSERYQVRRVLSFAADRRRVDVRAEAQWLDNLGDPIEGWDRLVLQSLTNQIAAALDSQNTSSKALQ